MATLVFGSIGAALGGPVGGAVGSLIGRQFDASLFGAPRRDGPRLKELAVTASSYGQPLPRHFGRMRISGSVIWATDLEEHSEEQGSGKGGPAITTYSYSANFAVALASRPIRGIGRIWADGKLLRGADGHLKVPGAMRLYTGAGDQSPDPLIASAEGVDRCPAYRGLAYLVFENLDLSSFYNRIPSLTFEVIADEAIFLSDIIGDVVEDADAALALPEITGFSSEQSPAADLLAFNQVMPLEIDAQGVDIVISRSRRQSQALQISEPAILIADDEFGGASGFSRQRGATSPAAPSILRYYDPTRDYQPSLQRATARPIEGEPAAIDLPAAMAAGTAKAMIEQVARRIDWSRDSISWRTCELDPQVAPGAVVALPDIEGQWRVCEWEWRDAGVELLLRRELPQSAVQSPVISDPGRANLAADLPSGPSDIIAFEMPYDPTMGSVDAARIFAAVSSPAPGWSGAALYADAGDGLLQPLGPSNKRRTILGSTVSKLGPANALMLDRGSQLIVKLIDPEMMLSSSGSYPPAGSDNLALVGEELLQFGSAVPLGDGFWKLQGLVRGLRGTENAIGLHEEHDRFAVLKTGITALPSMLPGNTGSRSIAAIGIADTEPAVSDVHLEGFTLRPLAPVHPRRLVHEDGSWTLQWTRRARGGWQWRSGGDVPMVEQDERYIVTIGPFENPYERWVVQASELTLPVEVISSFGTHSGALMQVRQQGTHALSHPLMLLTLP